MFRHSEENMFRHSFEEDMRIASLSPEEWNKECEDKFRKEAPIWMPRFWVEIFLFSMKPIQDGWCWSLLWAFPAVMCWFYLSLALSIAVTPMYLIYAYFLFFRDIYRTFRSSSK